MFVFAWLWNNLKALFVYLIKIPVRVINACKVLTAKVCWSIIKLSGKSIINKYQGYPDLCPTDDADNVEPYIEKLNDLLVNRRNLVSEIAITAPYSGGKSSLINTFLRRFPFLKYTSISLGAFKNTNETIGVADKTETSPQTVNANGTISSPVNETDTLSKIEKSIVQQLLYRTDSSKSPNSRFRRIFPVPISLYQGYFVVVSIFIWISLLAIPVYIPEHSPKIILDSISLSSSSENIYIWLVSSIKNIYLWLVSYLIALPIVILKDIYRHVGKLNLTKFNPMKGEVAFDQQKKDSIFNIYLEEIIYYFATEKSDVVIFEDIDRFKEPDIFIKLKELNKLINDSKDVKQKVRFIYALRDDVFKGKDRTKFFDAIIPVIPIANKSNSYPQLKQLIHDAKDGLESSLDESFLRDISVYVDDMRMMKNIVAEFGIYKDVLQPSFPKLDLQKLFSFIIYKNIYCDDFALLHSGEGMLATFFNDEANLKKARETKLIEKISIIENKLINSDHELTSSVEELNSYYILSMLDKIANHGIMVINDKPIKEIAKSKVFDAMLKDKNQLTYRHQMGGGSTRSHYTFSQWLNEAVPDYEIRKERIINKSLSIRSGLNSDLISFKDELERLRGFSARELLRAIPKSELFKDENNKLLNKIKDEKLLMHLLEKGYVDKHYHLYITHFHEGHMTNSDMDYVMSVKEKEETDRLQSIINPKETMKYFSDEEFRVKSFFNYDIINYLIKESNNRPLISMVDSLFVNTRKNHELISESFNKVKSKSDWLKVLHSKWNNFWIDIIENPQLAEVDKNSVLVNSFIAMNDNAISNNLFDEQRLKLESYISSTESISESLPENEDCRDRFFKALSKLGVKFQLLEKSNKSSEFIEQVLKHQLFVVNIENLRIVVGYCVNEEEQDLLSYSYLSSISNVSFKSFFEQNENEIAYLASEDLISVNNEDVAKILLNKNIKQINKLNIIDSVSFLIEKLEEFKEESSLFPNIIERAKFSPNWANLDLILTSGDDYTTVISTCMENEVAKLTNKETLARKEQVEQYKFILSTEGVNTETFAKYNNAYDIDYSCEDLSLFAADKLKYLINNEKLDVSLDVYIALSEIDGDLSDTYAILHFNEFVDDALIVDDFVTDTQELSNLLESKQINASNKKLLIEQRQTLIDEENLTSSIIETLTYPSIKDKYQPSENVPKLSPSKVSSLLTSITEYNTKASIILGQLQYLTEESVVEFLRLIGGELERILDEASYANLSDSRLNFCFLEGLKYYDYFVSTWSKQSNILGDKTSIKVNVKRK